MVENGTSYQDDSPQTGAGHNGTDKDVVSHDAARQDVTAHDQPEAIASEPASQPLTAEQKKYLARQDEKVRKVETVISVVLRTGVVVSVIVVAVGLAISFLHHPEYLSNFSYKELTNTQQYVFPHTFSGLFHSLSIGQGRGVVVLGLALLILTPVMRVAVSIFAFVYEEDPIMVVVTSFVLLMLVGSFFIGRAGG